MIWLCEYAGFIAKPRVSVSCIGPIDVDIDRCIYRYGKNSEISPGASVFQRPVVRGLYSGWGGGGAYIQREICVSKSVRLIFEGKFAF